MKTLAKILVILFVTLGFIAGLYFILDFPIDKIWWNTNDKGQPSGAGIFVLFAILAWIACGVMVIGQLISDGKLFD